MNLLIKHALSTLICLLSAQTPTKADADVLLRVALNEGTGNVAKGSGSLARSCAIENGEWVAEGLDGTCLKLSGTDSGIDLGELSLAAPFTFSCWLSPGAETVDMRLMGTRRGQAESVMALSLNYPAAGIISLWDGTRWCVVDPGVEFSDWKWIWLAVVVDTAKRATVYCNGMKVGTTTLSGKAFDLSRYWFGTRFENHGKCYQGLVDEIVVRNRALPSAEIQQLYDAECQRLKPSGNPRKVAIKKEPFIRIREVISSTPWGGWVKSKMPLELRQRFFLPFWPEARLRRHIEMLKAFGFNSIQVTIPTQALWVGADLQEWHQRQLFMLKTARELGLSTSMFVWGCSVADSTQGGQQYSEMQWHKPEDRVRLMAWYREQAEMAPYVDRVITHWVDPGTPQQGGIDTVVAMHNTILSIYREKNSKVRGALSTWFMGKESCPGFEGSEKLAAHPNLDPQTDIAGWVGNKNGRQGAKWLWYTADNEIQPALWVRMSVLERTFPHKVLRTQRKTLEATWTEGLAWVSLDDNFPGLNMQNLYVAGKLMQDPSLDAQELLNEFASGFVGEANAAAFAAALRAVERARTLSDSYSSKVLDAVEPPPDLAIRGENMDTTWLNNTSQAVDAAIAGMMTVKLPPEFKTAWPVTMEPAEYLVELSAHLEAIRQMLAFLKGAREVTHMIAAKSPADTIEAAINALPKVIYDPAHTAGLEADIYAQKLAELKRAASKAN